MTHNAYRIVEDFNEPTRRAIFYLYENGSILGVFGTRREAEESLSTLAPLDKNNPAAH